jgi:hypothetical protein
MEMPNHVELTAVTNFQTAGPVLQPNDSVDGFFFVSVSGKPQLVSPSSNGKQLHFDPAGVKIVPPLRAYAATAKVITKHGDPVTAIAMDQNLGPVASKTVMASPSGLKILLLEASGDERIDYILVSGGANEATIEEVCVLGEAR